MRSARAGARHSHVGDCEPGAFARRQRRSHAHVGARGLALSEGSLGLAWHVKRCRFRLKRHRIGLRCASDAGRPETGCAGRRRGGPNVPLPVPESLCRDGLVQREQFARLDSARLLAHGIV